MKSTTYFFLTDVPEQSKDPNTIPCCPRALEKKYINNNNNNNNKVNVSQNIITRITEKADKISWNWILHAILNTNKKKKKNYPDPKPSIKYSSENPKFGLESGDSFFICRSPSPANKP